jgi:hypothetical protein
MNRSIGLIVLNFAVAIYLTATGIIGLGGRRFLSSGGEIRDAVSSIFKGDFAEIIIVILSVLAIVAGVFVLLKLFGVDVPMAEMLLVILAIVWVVFIIIFDVIRPINNSRGFVFVDWLRVLGAHLMALGGILLATERFGG